MRIPPVPRIAGKLLAALPQYPHSIALSVLSTLFVRIPFAPADAERVENKVVCLNVFDAGIRIKMRIGRDGYLPCRDATEPDVTVSAGAREFVLLALRKEDPDTLFFDRRLCVEGDTELGLIVKNALDRVELPLPARLLELLRNHLS